MFALLPNPVQPSVLSVLLSTIARRLTPQPIKLRADIELTCYTPAGIDAIKKALRAGEAQSNEAVPIKAKLVAPPLYVLSTNATDKVSVRIVIRREGIERDRVDFVDAVCCRGPPRACDRVHPDNNRGSGRVFGGEDEGTASGPMLNIESSLITHPLRYAAEGRFGDRRTGPRATHGEGRRRKPRSVWRRNRGRSVVESIGIVLTLHVLASPPHPTL